MHTTTSNTGLISFVVLLSLTCSAAKIVWSTGWPWLWVLAPVWIALLSVVVLFLIMGVRVASHRHAVARTARLKADSPELSLPR